MTLKRRGSDGRLAKHPTTGNLVKECSDTDPPPDIRAKCDNCCYGSNTSAKATISIIECVYVNVGCTGGLKSKSVVFHIVGIIAAETEVTYIQTSPSAADYNEWVSSDGAGNPMRVRCQIGISVLSSSTNLTCPITNARKSVFDGDKFVFLRHSCSGAWQVGFNTNDSSGPVANEGQGSPSADPIHDIDPCQSAAIIWCDQWNTLGSPCFDNLGANECAPSTDTCCRFVQSRDACGTNVNVYYYRNHDITVQDNNGCLCSDNTNCINTSDQTNVACTDPATNCTAPQGTDCPP